jgi:hypothetical protein
LAGAVGVCAWRTAPADRIRLKIAPPMDASIAEEMWEGLRKNMPDGSTRLEGF